MAVVTTTLSVPAFVGSVEDHVPGAGDLVKVKFFMSGGGYAVSKKGAAKLLKTFPCVEGVCSMAIDWHYSTLIDRGLINVYANVPGITVMPDQGAIQPYNVPQPTKEETMACGGKYYSDTHWEAYKGGHARQVEVAYERWQMSDSIFAGHRRRGGLQPGGVRQAGGRRGRRQRPGGGKAGSDDGGDGGDGGDEATQGPFSVHLGMASWHEAEKGCIRRGGHLASIRNAEENSVVGRLLYQECGHIQSNLAGWDLCGWIGLNDFAEEGKRVWADGWQGDFENFVQGEPNNVNGVEDGMAMCWSFQNRWIDFTNKSPLPCAVCRNDT